MLTKSQHLPRSRCKIASIPNSLECTVADYFTLLITSRQRHFVDAWMMRVIWKYVYFLFICLVFLSLCSAYLKLHWCFWVLLWILRLSNVFGVGIGKTRKFDREKAALIYEFLVLE